jgi:hypothetical protein
VTQWSVRFRPVPMMSRVHEVGAPTLRSHWCGLSDQGEWCPRRVEPLRL